jgi:hypothetical protein
MIFGNKLFLLSKMFTFIDLDLYTIKKFIILLFIVIKENYVMMSNAETIIYFHLYNKKKVKLYE